MGQLDLIGCLKQFLLGKARNIKVYYL